MVTAVVYGHTGPQDDNHDEYGDDGCYHNYQPHWEELYNIITLLYIHKHSADVQV